MTERSHWRLKHLNSMMLGGCLLLVAVVPAMAGDLGAPAEAELTKARGAVKALAAGLMGALSTSLKSDGPVAAIEVCKTVAPLIAADTGTAQDLEIGRTALKVRNPANAPDAWERGVLEDFAKKIADGADAAKLEQAAVMAEKGATMVRYMKAIPMVAEPCLACHGSDISPAVKAEIEMRYPEDAATGFKAGELRGAFTVTMKRE